MVGNMVFKSKIDTWVLVLTFGITAMAVLPLCFISFSWWDVLLPFIVLLFLVDMFCNTKYAIKDDKLLIQCGHFMKECYPILSIKKIEDSNSWESAPALSVSRIRITFVDGKSILVSPKNKKGFVDAIAKVNNSVELVVGLA